MLQSMGSQRVGHNWATKQQHLCSLDVIREKQKWLIGQQSNYNRSPLEISSKMWHFGLIYILVTSEIRNFFPFLSQSLPLCMVFLISSPTPHL